MACLLVAPLDYPHSLLLAPCYSVLTRHHSSRVLCHSVALSSPRLHSTAHVPTPLGRFPWSPGWLRGSRTAGATHRSTATICSCGSTAMSTSSRWRWAASHYSLHPAFCFRLPASYVLTCSLLLATLATFPYPTSYFRLASPYLLLSTPFSRPPTPPSSPSNCNIPASHSLPSASLPTAHY